MKNFYIKLAATWLIVMFFQLANGQNSNTNGFDLMGKNQETTQIKKDFTTNAEIYPFTSNSPIYGIAAKGKITFTDNNGLVRIILVDKVGDETLVYESYPLLDGATTVNINNLAEETGILDAVTPKSIKIEVKNATLSLQSVMYSLSDDPSINKAAKKAERKGLQNTSKIARLNANIQAQKKSWVAGETGVSALSYAERKKLFGQSTFPSGIEYYVGGVISAGDGTTLKSATTGSMVENWDWRDRHGKNWVTGTKDQGACGSCWAFAATGATEALVNLFYNQQLNLDLSEQSLLSCSGAGSCSGGFPSTALDYVKNTGIIDEAAFPYTATDQSCTNKSSNPTDQLKIGGRVDFGSADYPVSEDNLKKMVIKYGPISGGLVDWSHAMTMVGWKVVKEGDKFFYRNLTKSTIWYTVQAGDALIGKTVWIFKNSWGVNWGDYGYVYVETSITNFAWTHALVTPVVSLKQNYTVQCTDNDHDGYYWWGLGPKPANCPPCPDAEDGNDNDATLGPLDNYGYCIPLTGTTTVAPVVNFSADANTITSGGQVQFSDMSTNTPTSWSWTFSGPVQITSSLQNPSVVFSTGGVYSVTLKASNAAGSATLTKSNQITVNAPQLPAPVAAFSANQTSVLTGGQVQFSDQSTNTPTAWLWTISGPATITSALQNPTLSFSTPGSYSVTLKAANASGENSLTKTNFITVSYPLVADFVVDNTAINEGQTVVFSDLSTGTPVSWSWSLPGGNPSVSNQKNPSVSYGTSGKYDVTLVVTNANGKSTKLKAGYITVNSVVPTYSSSHGNASKEWISQVSLNGTTFNSVSSGSAGYADLTSNTFNVAAGTNYTMTLTPKYQGKANYWYWSVWIDFNHDFDFNDAGEQVLVYSKSKTAISKAISIPSTALAGNTRMRISMKRDALPLADEVFAYGEVKDYTISIAPGGSLKNAGAEISAIESQLEVAVYPNPTDGIINLEIENAQSQPSFSIYNIQGSKIKSGIVSSDLTSIDLSDLKSGIYIISVKDENQTKQIKFIKR